MEKADYVQMMQRYSDVTKTYVQLAISALIFPTTFIRHILGVEKGSLKPYLNGFLISGWVFLLICAAAGLLYQIVAARKIAEFTGWAPHTRAYPRLLFNTSIISFFLGLLLFGIGIFR